MQNEKNCVLCSRSSTLKSMRSFIKLGKQRPPRARSCDSGSDTSELLDRRDSSCATSNEPSRTNSMTSLETNVSDYDSQGGINTTDGHEEAIVKPTKKSKPKVRSTLRIRLTLLERITCLLRYKLPAINVINEFFSCTYKYITFPSSLNNLSKCMILTCKRYERSHFQKFLGPNSFLIYRENYYVLIVEENLSRYYFLNNISVWWKNQNSNFL